MREKKIIFSLKRIGLQEMGKYHSVSSAPQIEISESFASIKEVDSLESEETNLNKQIDFIYVLVHDGEIKYYIQDETLLDTKIQYYMRQVFQEYISRWDAFNFNVVTQEGISSPETGLVKRIRLMSRARYLLGLHDQIEEEIEIYKIPSFPGHLDEEESEKVEEEDNIECEEQIES